MSQTPASQTPASQTPTSQTPATPTPMPTAKLTPAMAQYMHFKGQHRDAILFFRMGDFYEMFYDDAREVSSLLGLTLSSRSHGKSVGEVPLVPTLAAIRNAVHNALGIRFYSLPMSPPKVLAALEMREAAE